MGIIAETKIRDILQLVQGSITYRVLNRKGIRRAMGDASVPSLFTAG